MKWLKNDRLSKTKVKTFAKTRVPFAMLWGKKERVGEVVDVEVCK